MPRAFSAAVAGQGWVNTCPSGMSWAEVLGAPFVDHVEQVPHPGAHDEPQPGSLDRHAIDLEGDAPAANTVTSCSRWVARNALITDGIVAVSALLPPNAATVRGNRPHPLSDRW